MVALNYLDLEIDTDIALSIRIVVTTNNTNILKGKMVTTDKIANTSLNWLDIIFSTRVV